MYSQHSTQVITMSESDPISLQETSDQDLPEKHIDQENLPETHEKHSPEFEAFLKGYEVQPDTDSKLQLAIDFMEMSLAQGGTPHFRSFWEARRLCLPLFKENVSPLLRTQLWNKYSELSKEARRLKEILDEQSAFAVEQIEIAITALEKEIEQFGEQVAKSKPLENLVLPAALNHQNELYNNLQTQLNILNTQASRINGLRKELIKTEMRVRHKNKFFQRLSHAGDAVFPKRKELIKQISHQFTEDVDQFIKSHFHETKNDSLFALREEIKTLQGLAKHLTLNTSAFTQTRLRLSECWDKMRVEEKERKKERAQQKVVFKQNADLISQQIKEAKEAFEQNSSVTEGNKKIDEIVLLMRKTQLGRDELKSLRDDLQELRKQIQDKTRSAEELRQQQDAEKNRQKKEQFQALKEQVENLLKQHETYEADALIAERDALLTQIQESPLMKMEKQELERMLKPLRDAITEKKEKDMLKLSDDDRQALQQLKEVLNQRKERRQEIKNQLELLRKGAGSSSLDFEKAMTFTAQINDEKERLEKANQGILEIERKIADLQKQLQKAKE